MRTATTRPTSPDDALVPRPRLLERLESSGRSRVVLLTGPAGYSKTTCLTEWSEHDRRPFAWVTVRRRHDDPAVLIASMLEALGQLEVLDSEELLRALSAPDPNFEGVIVPRLQRTLEAIARPLVLVVDDVHNLSSGTSFRLIEAAIEALPARSQVALASRSEPDLALGRMRAHRELAELTAGELAMTREETAELLRSFGLRLTRSQVEVIFNRTEGWPAALYLASLSLADQPHLGAAVESFAGDERVVVDYLRDEFLSIIDPDTLDFLVRSSVLDELAGSLCDALLGRSGSGRVLESLARTNALVIPLDRRGHRYRYHHLFGEMLRSELHRRDPDGERLLHARASHWYAQNGDVNRAVEHAIESGDLQQTGELVWRAFPEVSGRGQIATLQAWLERIGDERIARSGKLCLSCAHRDLSQGQGDRAAHWTRIAESTIGSPQEGRDSIRADVLLLRATFGADGMAQIGRDASRSAELHAPEAPWQAPCYLYRGVSSHLSGHPERARPLLQEAVRRGTVVSPVIEALALAQLCLIAIDDEDPAGALRLITQAVDQMERCGLTEYPSMGLVFATSALARAHAGRMERARSDADTAKRLLASLVEMPPWYEAEARIALAAASIRLDQLTLAHELLAEAEVPLGRLPDAAILSAWFGQTRGALEDSSAGTREGHESLTTAELRTLQFLPSHLSFREIGERVYVSTSTVKTQVRAVYRKLDASSRTEAVDKAREAGLLDGDSLGDDQ